MCGGKETIMPSLHDFIGLLEGCFDNREQFEDKKKQGMQFPYAKHINTVCNGRIADLPQDFAGVFLLEESYYTSNGKTHASPHLFLFTEENGAVTLTSYQMPEGYTNDTFTAGKIEKLSFQELKVSEKFTPAVYTLRNGVWEGGSVSMFSPVLKFTLFERFSAEWLEVSESMEVNGKRTFGYDEPIIYKRIPAESC